MDSTMVTPQLNKFWKITVNKDFSRAINGTLICKMITMTVHEKEPSRKREVVTIINYDVQTAHKFFYKTKGKVSVVKTGIAWQTFQPQSQRKKAKTTLKTFFIFFPKKLFLHFRMTADQVVK